MSCSFTDTGVKVEDPFRTTRTSPNQPRQPDEKVAKLHLTVLGAGLTVLPQEQAVYPGAKVEGPGRTSRTSGLLRSMSSPTTGTGFSQHMWDGAIGAGMFKPAYDTGTDGLFEGSSAVFLCLSSGLSSPP